MVARVMSAKPTLRSRRALDADLRDQRFRGRRRCIPAGGRRPSSALRRTLTAAAWADRPASTACRLLNPPMPSAVAALSPVVTVQGAHVAAELLGGDLRQHGPGALSHGGGAANRRGPFRTARCAPSRARTARGRCLPHSCAMPMPMLAARTPCRVLPAHEIRSSRRARAAMRRQAG